VSIYGISFECSRVNTFHKIREFPCDSASQVCPYVGHISGLYWDLSN